MLTGTLISCVHGRDRRNQRNIGKHDLLAAIKYGVKEPAFPCRNTGMPRWKYTFANIVYITDESSRREVTSYVLPFELHPVSLLAQDYINHQALKLKLLNNPKLCTSHSVLIIDQSGSMRTSDVDGYRNRSDAVYGTIALDFIGAQLDKGLIPGTDVVTLIEMKDDSVIIWDREPITNVLYNTCLELKKTSTPKSHGHYINAIQVASRAMNLDYGNPNCALLLLFLSDGRPSDGKVARNVDIKEIIGNQIDVLASIFKKQLTVGTIGFSRDGDFSILSYIADRATSAGATGIFQRSESCSAALSNAISRLGTTLSLTRTRLTMTAAGKGVLRNVPKENHRFHHNTRDTITNQDWDIYEGDIQKAVWDWNKRNWTFSPLEDGIAIRKKIFGEGAERIVYQLAKIQRSNQGFYIARNIKLVAKESKFVINDENEKLKFHEVFCKTQSQSGDLANKFNQMLHKHRHLPNFALVKFLDCAVYVMNNDSENRNECWGILVEKMLNPDLYKKWNDNQGTVDGINKEHRVNFLELFESLEVEAPEMPIKKTRVQFCDVIAEEEDSEDEKGELIVNPKQQSSLKNEVVLTYDDFPQAFSHYTYFYSNRKKLVCDLQGVLDKSQNPPVFELTDPVIHYASSKGRKKVFGRTDRGKYGIMDFFKTHKCNAVCLLLGLPSDFKK